MSYSLIRNHMGLSEVQLIPQYGRKGVTSSTDPVTLCLDAMADANHPVVGDRHRGGLLASGGLRLRVMALVHDASGLAHSWTMPPGWWPTAPLLPKDEPDEAQVVSHASSSTSNLSAAQSASRLGRRARSALAREVYTQRPLSEVRDFMVSEATMRILEGGHPWVIHDRDTSDRARFEVGEVVRLRTTRGKLGPFALVEGPGDIAARVWSWEEEAVEDFYDEVDLRVDEALVRRASLLRDTTRTDLFRLIHGEADGLPGLLLDRVGPLLRATLTSQAARAFTARVYEHVMAFDPRAMLLEVAHLDDVRTRGELPRAEVVYARGEFVREEDVVVGLERGLRYECQPWEGIDTGFFADQRDNRALLTNLAAPGQTWVNLFGHTGAFNVALADRGAVVINVDISNVYVEWTARNMALNQLDASLSQGVAEDARVFMKQLDEPVHGIILDPPTAAQSEAGFWSVRKGYEALLVRCLEMLEPGGVLLACRNTRKKTPALDELVRSAARRCGRHLTALDEAPPSPDYPRVAGFPEGDSFEGWLARVR